ncbi:unnamed protein product [Miscanthus lutarioriparius]|uniref:Uncharacterized protein n=1 Tax=Miscanthus lutarioriparius TaxID=422564 RepID=A0A811MZH7_9POAL|nr:unnamed protein product [Miscanthus lutarioriparius]
MENKLASHWDMELLKMAMRRHEETFRQQVHELHRLYHVQKQLMGGLSRPSSELSCRRQKRRRRQPRRALDLHLPLPADECVVVTPPSAEDGLELTLAIGTSGGRCQRRQRDEPERTGTATPLASESNISGGSGSLTASESSTDTGGSAPYQIQRAMTPVFRLQEATTVPKVKPPPRSPWLVQCVSLEMA